MTSAAAALSLLTACDPGDPRILGVTRGADGGLELRIALCAGDTVEWLEVKRLGINDAPPDDPDTLLWRAVTSTPVALSSVRVGEAPAGFREEVAWDPASLRTERSLSAVVHTTRSNYVNVVFKAHEAVPGRVFAEVEPGRMRLMSEERFRRNARNDC